MKPNRITLAICLAWGLGLLTMPLFSFSVSAAEPLPPKYRVYVGAYTTYGKKEGKGIYSFEFDPHTGKATTPKLVAEVDNPSFLTIPSDASHLYACIEVNHLGDAPEQKNTGGVAAFQIDPKTGDLKHLNTQPAHGTITCHVSLDSAARTLLAANYGTGATAVTFRINDDGSLTPAVSTVEHTGSSANQGRQERPHGHSINLTPDGKFAVVADLGTDQLVVYPFDSATGKLDATKGVSIPAQPGAGPRHFTFHPTGKFAYHNNELNWTVTAYQYADQKLTPLQTITTVPEDWTGSGGTAEIAVHPSGKFLYVSNRGPDTLAIYQIQENGTLKPAGFASTLGKIPRNFVIDPSGTFLLAANQDSDNIFVFTIDQETGALAPTGEVINVPMPVCVRLVPLK
ncbi:MAG TPA: lactonase family protein [Planctomicrobium sp.]|nr:lactonase family protein [Planctomicrobium sp.]